MKSDPRPTNKLYSLSKRFLGWGVLVFVITSTSAYLAFSETAHAGLLSFMSGFLGSEQASAKVLPKKPQTNSQIMPILAAAVNQDPNPEKPADTVPVDDDGETLMADISAANGSQDINSQISTYTVRDGDTLTTIAQMFKVSVNTIVWANNISRTTPLKAGQQLIILPVTGISYTVKRGDTIKGIVSKYKGDLQEVLDFNDLTLSSSLTVGQSIIIPDAELPSTPVAKSPTKKTIKVGNEPLLDGWNWPLIIGYFIRPITGGVKSQGLHGHNAVDLAAPVGTPIHAAAAGTVIIAKNGGWNGGYGSFVVISHSNGTQSLYAHLSRSAVGVGSAVSQGQTIGYIGMTGLTTGPHVHFEIRGAQNPF